MVFSGSAASARSAAGGPPGRLDGVPGYNKVQELSWEVHVSTNQGSSQIRGNRLFTIAITALAASVDPRFGSAKDFEAAVEEIKQVFEKEGSGTDQVSTEPHDLLGHGFSPNTYHAPRVPAVIVYVESNEDVVRVMKIASKYKVPVVPWSGGTSLEGHITAPYGGISVDLSRMDKILELSVPNSDIKVQSGVEWQVINEHLAEQGIKLFFPLDPGPGATIGGMIATGCSGTNAVRYGTAKAEWFLNATVVLPSGEVIKTRSRARKSSAGFDVTKIFIGAEATLRLAPLLPTRVAICSFPDVKQASEAVYEILNAGVPIQCVELCDTIMMKAINQASLTNEKFPMRDSIFFKFQGSEKMMDEAYSMVSEIVPKYGGQDLRAAASKEESDEIWRGRKVAHWSIMALNPGAKSWSTDVCIPVSKLPELIKTTQEDLKECGLTAAVLGHVGDGNFHTGILFENQKEYEIADGAVHRMVERAIALEGTCTGEHGVGVGKKEYLISELGLGTVNLMKTVKNAIDPLGIMNPGKLYPDDLPSEHVVASWGDSAKGA
ncbi:d-lactate dehydrogenase oxidoreductase protein [Phaffia rhodozyma]|uniref:D-lactate dehydrogenase (cytochrome) n=1 Tax=Phaffia rhodozyma TaxID=264483 RepID=A0A0F7SGA9_PHARH|nr:d-lactate dehydrogenase oxidoreductase protein [Phaffia rhodozyma]